VFCEIPKDKNLLYAGRRGWDLIFSRKCRERDLREAYSAYYLHSLPILRDLKSLHEDLDVATQKSHLDFRFILSLVSGIGHTDTGRQKKSYTSWDLISAAESVRSVEVIQWFLMGMILWRREFCKRRLVSLYYHLLEKHTDVTKLIWNHDWRPGNLSSGRLRLKKRLLSSNPLSQEGPSQKPTLTVKKRFQPDSFGICWLSQLCSDMLQPIYEAAYEAIKSLPGAYK